MCLQTDPIQLLLGMHSGKDWLITKILNFWRQMFHTFLNFRAQKAQKCIFLSFETRENLFWPLCYQAILFFQSSIDVVMKEAGGL